MSPGNNPLHGKCNFPGKDSDLPHAPPLPSQAGMTTLTWGNSIHIACGTTLPGEIVCCAGLSQAFSATSAVEDLSLWTPVLWGPPPSLLTSTSLLHLHLRSEKDVHTLPHKELDLSSSHLHTSWDKSYNSTIVHFARACPLEISGTILSSLFSLMAQSTHVFISGCRVPFALLFLLCLRLIVFLIQAGGNGRAVLIIFLS